MSLGALPEDLATTFLLDRTGRRDPSAIDPDELVACRRLVEATAGLPLALEQAAAYIHQQGSRFGFADYMRLYEEATKELLSKGVLGSTEYPDSVATTWKTTVRQLSAEAAALLRLLSYVATTPLQLIALYDNVRLVRDEAAGLPYGLSVMLIDVNSIIRGEGSTGQSNEMWIREKIRELTAYSMLQSDGESIVVHPLVQVVERLNTASQPRGDRDTIHRSTELIFKAASGDPGDVDSWSIWEPLEPHVREVARHADLSGITNLTANLLVRYSQFLSSKSQFPQAEASARRAITIHEVSSHINLPRGLSALAMILESTNRPQEAEPLFRRALEIAEEADGPHHPRVAQCLNDLSVFLVNTGRVAEAEPLIRRALAIDEATHGPVHSAVARDLHQLARVLDDEERWDEAELLLRRALAVSEKCHGPEHPDVARDLGSLAMLLQDTGRSGEAASLLQRALAIDQARFGPNHPSVAVRLNNLAHLVSPTEAEALLGRALVIWSSNLGSDHPTVALCLNNLASIHFGLNRLQDAEQGFRRSLEIYLRSFVATGQRHPKRRCRLDRFLGGPLDLLQR
jgi:tetratricopeptide (TPR) repeat protein